MPNLYAQPSTKGSQFANRLAEIYLTYKENLLTLGYTDEIEWQQTRRLEAITESDFMTEASWVIISVGLSNFVVERVFPKISEAYHWWVSASKVARNTKICEKHSLSIFRNPRKIHALSQMCINICDIGFNKIITNLIEIGPSYLSIFPFIGPVTSLHLAKNLGYDVVKPDRHLARISNAAGFDTPHELCSKIAEITGERLSVIDLVLWRYATLHNNYLEPFQRVRF